MAIDLEKLQDSPHLIDIIIQMEDVLDTLDIYVFKNWIHAEIVEGPKVRRYWLDFTLKFPFDKMPDPKAAMRLLKHGIRVDYEKAKEGEANNTDDVWLVSISIPRRLIDDTKAGELETYDDEVDIEDVQDGNDSGITDESGYVDPNENTIEEIPDEEENPDEETPNDAAAPTGAPSKGAKPNG